MLSPINRLLSGRLVSRAFSQAVKPAPSQHPDQQLPIRQPYFVRRNSRGSLPVYSDIRNGGTRYLISIRNVEGHLNALAQDLKQSLFPSDSPQAKTLTVRMVQQKHVVVTGGRFKRDVMAWLTEKGF